MDCYIPIHIESYMYWDITVHIGFGLFGGYYLTTLDASSFVYDFRGGTDGLILQTRLGATWDTFIIDNWTTDVNLVEATSVSGTISADANAGDSTISLNTGDASNFTEDKFYFLYDLNLSEAIDYVKVTSITNDVLTLNSTITHTHISGSLLSPYYQRFYTYGTDKLNSNYYPNMSIPCRSAIQQEFGISNSSNQNYSYSKAGGHVLENLILYSDPNDEDKYIVMKPLIGEYDMTGPTSIGNRAYGVANSVYYTAVGTMAQMLNGKTINSKQWVYSQTCSLDPITSNSIIAMLIPNYNEV